MRKKAILSLAIAVAATAAVIATPLEGLAAAENLAALTGSYRIDPASDINFSVAQVGGGGIEGRFHDFSGTFVLDAKNLGRSQVDFALKPASVTTGQPRVENFLKSSAVFNAPDYPVITFRSTNVTPTGEKTARIDGQLTARGQTHKATFEAELDAVRAGRVDFHVTGIVYRVPFGMGIGVPIYSNEVRFDMRLRGTRP